MTTGTELSQAGAKLIRPVPWWLFYTMNSRRATPSGMVGFPDHTAICYRHPFPFIAFVEVKGEGDKLKLEQMAFAAAMRVLCGRSKRLMYVLLERADQWDLLLEYDGTGPNFICDMKLEPPALAGE